jgi:hypothetical protein
MKLSQVLSDIAIAIQNDAAIEAFCQAQYTKSISVYVHIDPKNPPSISKAPWVGLTIQGYRRPLENNARLVEFDIESALYCAGAGETTVSKVTTLDGFSVIEDLSDLVFSCIENAIDTSPTQLQTTTVNEQQTSISISDFPGWIASRVFTAGKHV